MLADVATPGALWVHHQFTPMSGAHEITAANAGMRLGFALKSRVGLGPQPGVAEISGVRPRRRQGTTTQARR